MPPTVADSQSLQQAMEPVLAAISDAWPGTAPEGAATPAQIAEAWRQFRDVVDRVDNERAHRRSDAGVAPEDITRLGEYGLGVVLEADAWVERLALRGQRDGLDELELGLALWIADGGGELVTLDPVVDAMARLANATSDTDQLAALADAAAAITGAVAPALRRDIEKTNPGRPWRVLLLNRAITATRSHDPTRMEDAFASLTTHLPEEAAGFFREGMQQMEALGYPEPVRDIMARWADDWATPHMTH